MAEKLIFRDRFVEAVCASTLRRQVKHFLMVLAHRSDWKTGVGISGQLRIAADLGTSVREVQRLYEEVKASSALVSVATTYRSRSDGRGRSSDSYQLLLAGVNWTGPTGQPGPVEGTTNPTASSGCSDDQPDQKRRPTRQDEHDQPDQPVGGSEQKIRTEGSEQDPAPADASAATAPPLSLKVQDPKPRGRRAGRPKGEPATKDTSSRKPKPTTPRTRKTKAPEDDRPESPRRLLRAHYDAEHERIRNACPVFPRTKESRVGKAWMELLEVVDLDAARAVVTRALTAGYHVEPWQIADNVNRYRGPEPARPNGARRAGPVQPNAEEMPPWLRPKEIQT